VSRKDCQVQGEGTYAFLDFIITGKSNAG